MYSISHKSGICAPRYFFRGYIKISFIRYEEFPISLKKKPYLYTLMLVLDSLVLIFFYPSRLSVRIRFLKVSYIYISLSPVDIDFLHFL